jgi:hypothetical protein
VALRELADCLEDKHVRRAVRLGRPWAGTAEPSNVTLRAAHEKHADRLRAAGITTRRSDHV